MVQIDNAPHEVVDIGSALQLAKLSCSYDRIFTGLVVDGLPLEGCFSQWVEKFQNADREVRERMTAEGPCARYSIEGNFGWFFGKKIVEFTEFLKHRQNAKQSLNCTNYLTILEVYEVVHPMAQDCAGALCLALADLALTRQFSKQQKDVYGVKELEELQERIETALEHFHTGMKGVIAMKGNGGTATVSSGGNVSLNSEQRRLLHLWELLEVAIPRLKENDKTPLNRILEQLMQSVPGATDPNQVMGGESEQGFVFKLRQKVGNQLDNRVRALLSETRASLLQSRREFLTIFAYITTFHQMIVAPRAYEEANAAVQYALLSKQRRFATRACRDLPDQSPHELANIAQVEQKSVETEAAIDPNRLLTELSERGQITVPKDYQATAEVEKVKGTGMHLSRLD